MMHVSHSTLRHYALFSALRPANCACGTPVVPLYTHVPHPCRFNTYAKLGEALKVGAIKPGTRIRFGFTVIRLLRTSSPHYNRVQCAPGRRRVLRQGAARETCEPCPAGRFQPYANQAACYLCQAGRVSMEGWKRCIVGFSEAQLDQLRGVHVRRGASWTARMAQRGLLSNKNPAYAATMAALALAKSNGKKKKAGGAHP